MARHVYKHKHNHARCMRIGTRFDSHCEQVTPIDNRWPMIALPYINITLPHTYTIEAKRRYSQRHASLLRNSNSLGICMPGMAWHPSL